MFNKFDEFDDSIEYTELSKIAENIASAIIKLDLTKEKFEDEKGKQMEEYVANYVFEQNNIECEDQKKFVKNFTKHIVGCMPEMAQKFGPEVLTLVYNMLLIGMNIQKGFDRFELEQIVGKKEK